MFPFVVYLYSNFNMNSTPTSNAGQLLQLRTGQQSNAWDPAVRSCFDRFVITYKGRPCSSEQDGFTMSHRSPSNLVYLNVMSATCMKIDLSRLT